MRKTSGISNSLEFQIHVLLYNLSQEIQLVAFNIKSLSFQCLYTYVIKTYCKLLIEGC